MDTLVATHITLHSDWKPTLALEKCASVYQDTSYGPSTIRQQNGGLWQYDTFKAHWRDRSMEDAFLTFTLKPDGSVDQDLMFTPLGKMKK